MSETLPNSPPSFKKKIRVEKGDGLWLLAFGDLSMILISFFILMLSFSTVDKKKLKEVEENLRSLQDQRVDPKLAEKHASLATVLKTLKEEIVLHNLDKLAEIHQDPLGVSIEFKEGMLFESGSAEPFHANRAILNKIFSTMAKIPPSYELKIEGHTDDQPMHGGLFKSNWELSASRAMAVMRLFQQSGLAEERLSISAYGHTRPKVDYKTLQGENLGKARAANRRVVIRIE